MGLTWVCLNCAKPCERRWPEITNCTTITFGGSAYQQSPRTMPLHLAPAPTISAKLAISAPLHPQHQHFCGGFSTCSTNAMITSSSWDLCLPLSSITSMDCSALQCHAQAQCHAKSQARIALLCSVMQNHKHRLLCFAVSRRITSTDFSAFQCHAKSRARIFLLCSVTHGCQQAFINVMLTLTDPTDKV
eukprot:scaffold35368_cov18-Tisochrysis_lutea.AAC.1